MQSLYVSIVEIWWKFLFKFRLKILRNPRPFYHTITCCWRWLIVLTVFPDDAGQFSLDSKLYYFVMNDKREGLPYTQCSKHGIYSVVPTMDAVISLESVFPGQSIGGR